MAKYKAYPEYKDSGVDSFGSIPKKWSALRLKYIFEIKKRIAGTLGFDILSVTQKGIKIKDIDSGEGQLSMDYSKYQRVLPGEFAMNHMDLLTGYVDISKYDGVTSPDYRVFSVRDNNDFYSRYFLYLLQDGYKQRRFFHLGQGSAHLGRWRLPTEAFNEIIYPLPSLEEQVKIADFLDHETAKIDKLIEKQQQLIELLKEKHQAVISHAVTKGLNPDVLMKDSGVEWLGEVPEHWLCSKIKHIALLTPKKSAANFKPNDECTFIPMEKLKRNSLVTDESKFIREVINGYTYFEENDLLLAKVTPCFENKNIAVACGLVNRVGFGSTEIYVLRPTEKVQVNYLLYRLQEDNFIRAATGAMTGAGGLKRVPSDFLLNYPIAIPPKSEMDAIVDYLGEQEARYDLIEKNATNAVQLLQERRTALISAAVTGKIDVRDWIAPDISDIKATEEATA
ncbi:restriction endonuclease subunit S [Budvicia aquatica]|uniref:Restriction endonuclease subunit S n=2 Tax=Budvicia aquatica TaxID=82979 RepID=A0A2C6DHI5_9GAMM|nr:restriction endonuclease subunit S [Budvicia aquatica]PHI29748.1 restriction endonuclease subunit S [Budvicia aquatica]